MRTLMIETVKAGDTEIQMELTKAERDLEALIAQGLNVKELFANSTVDFLGHDATQYRVSVLAQGTFVSQNEALS